MILVFIILAVACSKEKNYLYELPNVEGGIRFPSNPKILNIDSGSHAKLVYWIGKDIKYFVEFQFSNTERFKEKYKNEVGPLIKFDSKLKESLLNSNRLIYGLDTTDLNNRAGMYVKDNANSHSIAYVHITNDYRFSFEVDFASELMLSKEEKWLIINNFIKIQPVMEYYSSLSKRFRRNLKQYDLDY